MTNKAENIYPRSHKVSVNQPIKNPTGIVPVSPMKVLSLLLKLKKMKTVPYIKSNKQI